MGLETQFNSVADLNASWPLPDDPLSQGDDHIRGVKNVFNVQFGTLGSDPLTVTALNLNELVLTYPADANGKIDGGLTFSDKSLDISWPTPLRGGEASLQGAEHDYTSANYGIQSGMASDAEFFTSNDDRVTLSANKANNGALAVMVGPGAANPSASPFSMISFLEFDKDPTTGPQTYKGGMQFFTKPESGLPYVADDLLLDSKGRIIIPGVTPPAMASQISSPQMVASLENLPDMLCCPRVVGYAVFDGAGTLEKSFGVTGITKTGTGEYSLSHAYDADHFLLVSADNGSADVAEAASADVITIRKDNGQAVDPGKVRLMLMKQTMPSMATEYVPVGSSI